MGGAMMRRRLRRGSALAVAICLLLGAAAHGGRRAPTTEELLRMTRESLRADWARDRAFVRGVGRITREGPVGRVIARRAALTDARRGLLLLRESILNDSGDDGAVSGWTPPMTLLAEGARGELYFVEVEASLSALLGQEDARAY